MFERFWWQEEEDRAHEAIFEYVKALEESQKSIHEQNLRHARLYSNTDLAGLGWTLSNRDHSTKPLGRVTENVIQSVIDTATSMIAKNRPKATFLTDGADFSTQRKAKQLDKFIGGQFQKTDIYKKAPGLFRDAAIFGTGALRIFDDDSEIGLERALIDDVLVDELECRACLPQQLHHRKFVHREMVKALYPEYRDVIDMVNVRGNVWTSYRRVPSEKIPVIESWHLPSGRKAGDGRYAVSVEGKTLVWEKYEKSYFPYIFYRWSEPLIGFYGQGLAEQLAGIQLRINKINRFIEAAQDLIAVPRIFVDIASRTLKAQITNEIGAVIPYRGKPPTFLTPTAVGAEIYQYKERLKASAFEFAGISQLSAQAKKPGGLESAVALREYNDIETQRFAIQAQAYEEVFLETARQMVALGKEIYGRKNEFISVFQGRNFIEKIDWSEVDLDEDCYRMDIEASSIMSRTPAGRLQSVIEMSQSGLIDMDEGRRLLDHPDLGRTMSIANAAIDDIEATIEELSAGKFNPPEPFQPLAMGMERVQMAYLRIRREGAPEEIKEGFRRWIEMAKHLLEPPAPPMGSGQPAAAPSPPGVSPGAAGPAPPIPPPGPMPGPEMLQ